MFSFEEIKDIVKSYEVDNESTYIIAKRYNTYPNKIGRILTSQGVKVRNNSDAQKVALMTNRSTHPTEGKVRDNKTKIKISEGVSSKWKTLTEDEKKVRCEKASESWNNLPQSHRDEMHRLAMQSVRVASKEGSKIEQYLQKELTKLDYNVVFHKKGLLANQELEVDLFLPHIKTAIEIDGPSHFLPIWGEEKLRKHIQADSDKSGLLLAGGFCIIRIKYMVKNLSNKYKRDILNIIVSNIKNIEEEFPPVGKRFLEIEVK